MHKLIIPALVALVCIGPVKAAEAPAVAPVPPDLTSPFSDSDHQQKSATQQVEDAVRTELARAGLTDIRIIPMSILVRAKDADGNFVTFFLAPNSIAELGQAPEEKQDDGAGARSIPGEEKF
jgi:hypothetical protein